MVPRAAVGVAGITSARSAVCDKENEIMNASASIRATALVLALAGTAVGILVSSATAQTVFPPVDVGGSFSARVENVYRPELTQGYYDSYAPRYGNAYDVLGTNSQP
jgi:hypothetical protein